MITGKLTKKGQGIAASPSLVVELNLTYLPVFTYWMQSPWFLKVLPSARV
jgi:hypothetical protein